MHFNKLKSSVCALALGLVWPVAPSMFWTPGPNQKAENFGQASGQCKMVAMGVNSGGGFSHAQGSPQFVGSYLGAVTVAGAIGGAVREQNVCVLELDKTRAKARISLIYIRVLPASRFRMAGRVSAKGR
jgi:hypothetical protein